MKLRITYNAPVVLTLTLVAAVVYVLTHTVGSLAPWFAAYPEFGDARTYAGLVTHVLGHRDWEHLLSNFMLILLIGPILEERHGSSRLLFMIVVTALVTGGANLVFGSNVLLGASGVAFMMILLASMANVRGGEIPLTFVAIAVIYMGGEIIRSLSNDQISHMAHLIGGGVGGTFGFLWARRGRSRAASPAARTAS